jgi:poly-gamma-glutamate synthesis protein (capsule biosynthesis protein)
MSAAFPASSVFSPLADLGRRLIPILTFAVILLFPLYGDGETYLTIIAAGDNLYSDPILRAFEKDGTYDFNPIYRRVRPLIEGADIALVNQETVFGRRDYSGYPLFNTPQEAGLALALAGFDLVNHGTNHALDQGEGGLFITMDFWDTLPQVTYLGIHRSAEARKNYTIIEKNHIRVGVLSYTYGTNSISLPRDKPWLVSMADTARMAEELDSLRPLCDFLIVSMHWGTEYDHIPTTAQKRTATFLAEHGVDLIIGHHPHVLQPWEVLPRPDGGENLCFYSLGNFVSAQLTRPTLPTLLGGLMYLKIKKTEGKISIEETGIIPVVTHFEQNYRNFSVYPLYEYTEELAGKHNRKSTETELSLPYFSAILEKIIKAPETLPKGPDGGFTGNSRAFASHTRGPELIMRNPFQNP